jgi:hypothetical protein
VQQSILDCASMVTRRSIRVTAEGVEKFSGLGMLVGRVLVRV